MAKPKIWAKRTVATVVVVVVLACVGFGAWASDYYHAGDAAVEAIATQAVDSDSYIAVGDPMAEYGLVLYPGAKVEAAAYAPFAEKLAERGVFCVIAKMPFNIAFFGANEADQVMDSYPDVSHWWVGGHSLGGVVAADYAQKNAEKDEGVALLASYCSESLAASGLAAEVVYGTNDGVVNRSSLEACVDSLPKEATRVIEGGNHAGFGDYGPQQGDGEATISADEQQEIAADAVAVAIKD